MNEPEVSESVLDMCAYGMTTMDQHGNIGLCRKTTRLLTNAAEIADATAQRCRGGHSHIWLESGWPKAAAEYPPRLCKAILKGFDFWLRRGEFDN